MAEIYQVLVRLLDGKHKILNFTSPSISANTIKHHLYEITTIPIQNQRLISNGRQLEDQTLTPDDGSHLFPTVHLLLRLRGGKGGFGSLLRGAATKAGQKKTNNFDACRDMSGRRLRHVNAEKKLEEWKAEEEERRLEKMADEFIKKKAKTVKKAGGSGDTDKYVEKYREESAKCMEVVERSVRESISGFVNSKRKATEIGVNGLEGKRLKIWMGKRKMGDNDSDSDDMDEDDNSDDEEENEKSVIINNRNHSSSNKEAEGSPGSVTGGKLGGESSDGVSSGSGSEGEGTVVAGDLEPNGSPYGGAAHSEGNVAGDLALEIHGEKMDIPFEELAVVSSTEAFHSEKLESDGSGFGNVDRSVGQSSITSSSAEVGDFSSGETDPEVGRDLESKLVVHEETVITSTNISDLEKPLNFDDYSSATEMEVLGMERLKSELQARGLKCGGTLRERAARLFLLKTTPVEMLPKKLLAKK